MTKQEAEVLAARLTRVWSPSKASHRYSRGAFPDSGGFYYTGEFPGNVLLKVDNDDDELNFDFEKSPVFLMAKPSLGIIDMFDHYPTDAKRRAYNELVEEWMPFFRRGCWLSGCDVEASAHEKAEWIRGFTQEEIEAWNLTQ